MGHFLADQQYGVKGSQTNEDQVVYTGDGIHHIHIDVLEYFDPNYSTDPFKWIPKGLMEDMIDNTPNEVFPVIDNISGFTIAQLFNALQSDVTTLQLYKARLINQNPNTAGNPNLSTQITSIFNQYHY
jgi:hypothetical protein